MPYIFVDYENVKGEYITILGLHNRNQQRTQLFEKTLTSKKFYQFLGNCDNGNPIYIFCHGPDVGRIQNHFGVELKKPHYCINVKTAFETFTKCRDCGLKELEQYFGIPRKYNLTFYQIDSYWNSAIDNKRQIVLDYNWEDCVNLRKLVQILKTKYGVTNQDFRNISME